MADNIFILKNAVTWSMLNDGFNIKTEARGLFNTYMKDILLHGESRDICIRIEGENYRAKLVNINFDRERWKGHKDLIQIRYTAKSAIARKLQSLFSRSYNYMLNEKANQVNKRCHIVLPETINEYYVLSATSEPYVFEMSCFTVNDAQHLTSAIPYLNSEDFENSEDDQNVSERIAQLTDPNASVEERERIVKVRKVDRSIIENLKFIYDYRCQITGEKIGEQYGKCVIEAHHIEYFSHSQNNDAKNIIIISPNYHRIIHRNNPHFNFETKCFEFDNGERLKLKLNEHL